MAGLGAVAASASGGLEAAIAYANRPTLNGVPASLQPLLDVQADDSGKGYHLGKLHFDDGAQAQQFIDGEAGIFQKMSPDQRAMQADTLQRVETDGLGSFESPAAHTNRTIDDLLTPTALQKNGSVQFGNLTVRHDEVEDFKTAERALAARNPEALDTLAQLESQPQKTALIHGQDGVGVSSFQPADQKLTWSPQSMEVYNNGTAANAPTNGLLHEETHAAAPLAVRKTLAAIPSTQYENLEEQRVIEGAEKRDLAILGKPARNDHEGGVLRATSVDSTTPELKLAASDGASPVTMQNGSIAGNVVGYDYKKQEMLLEQDGKPGTLRVPFDQIEGADGGHMPERIDDALQHHDHVTFTVRPDGVSMADDAAMLRAATP